MSKLNGEVVKEAISPQQRAANVRGYARRMGPDVAGRLLAARSEIVREFRAHPAKWPDGIDSKYDRWYRAEEWADDGRFLGARVETPSAGETETRREVREVEAIGSHEDPEPWVAAGVSRATWFRRRKIAEGGK